MYFRPERENDNTTHELRPWFPCVEITPGAEGERERQREGEFPDTAITQQTTTSHTATVQYYTLT